MKKLLLLVLMAITLFLAGCGAKARESGFYQHDAQYRNLDHLAFSWWGYTNPTRQDAILAKKQNWWGIEVPYVPAQ